VLLAIAAIVLVLWLLGLLVIHIGGASSTSHRDLP
jgi:hypothetical protein